MIELIGVSEKGWEDEVRERVMKASETVTWPIGRFPLRDLIIAVRTLSIKDLAT